MLNKTFSRRNLDFTIFEVLKIEELTKYAYFSDHDAETVGFTLDIATDIADKIMRPAYVDSDRHQPELVNGQVKVHKGVHDYINAYSEAGLIAAPFPAEYGGMQLPKMALIGVEFILGSAHNSMVMFTDLLKGVSNLIYTFGSDEQKVVFLPKILSGEWMSTMCLTETQAGSSLSDVATSATPLSDGTYKMKGQKIFISAGDHDDKKRIREIMGKRLKHHRRNTSPSVFIEIAKKQFCSITLFKSDNIAHAAKVLIANTK